MDNNNKTTIYEFNEKHDDDLSEEFKKLMKYYYENYI